MKKGIAEICCGSWMDCLAAARGGADRIELNSALALGGLTPSFSALCLAKRETNLKVIAMVRPRPAGFCYTLEETEEMMEEARILLEHGADGLAFGFLTEQKKIDEQRTAAMIELIHSYNKEAVFHRAFDCVKDPFEAIETLIRLKTDRVLTSGLQSQAIKGIALLKQLQDQVQDRMELVAGSGVSYENAADLVRQTGIRQLHSSCKGLRLDPTTSGKEVNYRIDDHDGYERVDEEKVRRFAAVMHSF